jgi:tetrahydromethanopterin S-methyltransferase subunit D
MPGLPVDGAPSAAAVATPVSLAVVSLTAVAAGTTVAVLAVVADVQPARNVSMIAAAQNTTQILE